MKSNIPDVEMAAECLKKLGRSNYCGDYFSEEEDNYK
jgi:hypothetical protein